MFYRAKDSFAFGYRVVPAGEVVPADDEAVAACPQMFEALGAVERATARPGEKRHTRRPADD